VPKPVTFIEPRDEFPGMKYCTNCGIKKTYDQFHADATRSDGYRDQCIACRRELARAAEYGDGPIRDLEEKGLEILSTMANSGGSFQPHVSEALEEMLTPFGGMRGFSKFFFANYLAAKPGSATRERMLSRITDLIEKVSDIGDADTPLDRMEEGDIIRVMATHVIEYQKKTGIGNNMLPTLNGSVVNISKVMPSDG
jgi:hypothetical protein